MSRFVAIFRAHLFISSLWRAGNSSAALRWFSQQENPTFSCTVCSPGFTPFYCPCCVTDGTIECPGGTTTLRSRRNVARAIHVRSGLWGTGRTRKWLEASKNPADMGRFYIVGALPKSPFFFQVAKSAGHIPSGYDKHSHGKIHNF